MKYSSIKAMARAEMDKELIAKSRELLNLRLRKSAGAELKSHLFKQIKKDIARLLTAMNEVV